MILPESSMVGRVCPVLDRTGHHDLRVDPSEIIFTVGPVSYVWTQCASCGHRERRESRRMFTNKPGRPETWRPYVEGDR